MEKIRRTKIVDLLQCKDWGSMVNVKGWVRTRRGSKAVSFIALNDGSTINNVQVVVDLANFDEEMVKLITTGACISVNGELVESIGSGQAGEIHADAISYASETDKKQVGIEIHSGKNRIVRRIFESLGYKVIKLDRVYFAGLTKKGLKRGDWRFLTEMEVNMLRMGSFE